MVLMKRNSDVNVGKNTEEENVSLNVYSKDADLAEWRPIDQ